MVIKRAFNFVVVAIVVMTVAMALILRSCMPVGAQNTGTAFIQRWSDDKYAVTCWVYANAGSYSGGISCLPNSQLIENKK